MTYSIINITGLAIGMAGTLLILMYVANEMSYENFHKNRNRIYRVSTDFGKGDSKLRFAGAMEPLAPAMTEQLPVVENAVRFQPGENVVLNFENKTFTENRFFFSDPSVFDIFSFKLIRGERNKVLTEPFSVVLTEATATKYFGDADPIDKILLYNNESPFKVTGIMEDVPENTHLRINVLASFSSLYALQGENKFAWTRTGDVYTYFLLKENASINGIVENLEALLIQHTDETYADILSFHLQRLPDIYMNSEAMVDIGPRGNKTYVTIFSIVAALILIIACFNFINLATAYSLRRLKEVGMRKVLGATRFQLFKQFLGESMVITIISVLLALVIFQVIYPELNTFLESSLVISEQNFSCLFIFIPLIVLVVGFLAGSYPALFLAKKQPQKTMLTLDDSGSNRQVLRKILVALQFAISVVLIIATIALFRQLNFMKNSDPGFNKENVLLFRFKSKNVATQGKYEALKYQFLQNPNVISVSGAYTVPGIHSKEVKTVQRAGISQEENLMLRAIAVDYDYLQTMAINLVDGRNFSMALSSDANESILINQTAVNMLKLPHPIGEHVIVPMKDGSRKVQIIGVFKDFHVASFNEPIEPLMLYINPQNYYTIAVRINPTNLAETLDYLERHWNSVLPETRFDYRYLKDTYLGLYVSEEKMGLLLNIFSILAVFVACLGLFGLIAFITSNKRKEIGIRKVLGASVSEITAHLVKDFLFLVVAANLIAWPVAWSLAQNWLHNYAYRIDLTIWMFFGTGLFTLGIALATISFQSIKAALVNPVESLRYE